MKPCIKCGSTDRKKNGQCKPCATAATVAWQKLNHDKINASRLAKASVLENREKHRIRCAEWRKNNPEKSKESSRLYYQNNTDKERIRAVTWKQKNPSAVKCRQMVRSAWKKNNPELCRVYRQNRRAKVLLSGGKLSNGLAEKLLKLQRGMCACCKQVLEKYHLDHRMPLALEGLNTDENIQLLCPKCNRQKSAKHPVDFMQELGFLI